MRRSLTLPLLAALAGASPLAPRASLAAQTSVYIPGGTATLTDDGTLWSLLDLQLQYFFGPPFSLPIQFDVFHMAGGGLVSPTLQNGAVAVGFNFPNGYSGPYTFGEFDFFMDPETLVGGVRPDPTNYPVISNSCEPVTPSGYKDDGTPFYGAVFAEIPGYFSTCAPGSYVDISMRIPHASSFIGLDPVTTTPEPSSLALLATGLVGVVAFARRKQLRARKALTAA